MRILLPFFALLVMAAATPASATETWTKGGASKMPANRVAITAGRPGKPAPCCASGMKTPAGKTH
jgi:hypothetical protein